jgi:hypothetical protein
VESKTPLIVTIISTLRPHFTSIKRAEELVKQLTHKDGPQANVLKPPTKGLKRTRPYPEFEIAERLLESGDHPTMAVIDIVFSGIGWISLAGRFKDASLTIWTPGGQGVYTRAPMMPFEFRGKIDKRINPQRKTLA